MQKVIIDRATWLNGGHNKYPNDYHNLGLIISSKLVSPFNSNKCCLGFLGLACGLATKVMFDINLPQDIDGPWPKELFNKNKCFSGINSNSDTWEFVFVCINDAEGVDDYIREAWIAEGFKTILEYEVEFINNYPP